MRYLIGDGGVHSREALGRSLARRSKPTPWVIKASDGDADI
jgi:hypothetical protein